jgi:signal transduction histidine kinase
VSGPPARRFASAFGDWLGSIGWGKFILLAVLLAILVALVGPFLPGTGETELVTGHVEVKVRVESDGEGGLQLVAPQDAAPAIQAPAKPGSGAKAMPRGRTAGRGKGDPDVRIDADGVHISAVDEDGSKVRVAIDQDGVRVQREPAAADASAAKSAALPPPRPPAPLAPAAAPHPPQGPSVPLPASLLADPAQVEQAVEAARASVEEIVQDQVDRQLESMVRDAHPHRKQEGWVEPLFYVILLALVIVKVVLGSKRKAEMQAERASAAAADEGLRRQLAEAQLKTMQAQIEPHFLFNTLASVDYLIETDPGRASRMQKNLIQYLRSALPQMREDSSTLARELDQCRAYLEILRMRMEERLQFTVNVPQGLLDARFPPMMLLTLVENSIKHGLEPKPEGGAVAISAGVAAGVLHVTVADTGLGLGAAGRGGTGVGLANLRERLRAMYGAAGRLTIEQGSAGGTIATIELPVATARGAGA